MDCDTRRSDKSRKLDDDITISAFPRCEFSAGKTKHRAPIDQLKKPVEQFRSGHVRNSLCFVRFKCWRQHDCLLGWHPIENTLYT